MRRLRRYRSYRARGYSIRRASYWAFGGYDYDRLLTWLASVGVLAPSMDDKRVGWRHLVLRAKRPRQMTPEDELKLLEDLRKRALSDWHNAKGAEIVLHYSARANVLRSR